MWNPFRINEEKKAQEAAQEQSNFELSANIAANPQAVIDEQNALERREVLVQLSQWQQDRKPAMQILFQKLSGYAYDPKLKKLVMEKWNKGYCNLIGSAKLVNYIESTGGNLVVRHEDDSTSFGTQAITTDSGADPITKLDTAG